MKIFVNWVFMRLLQSFYMSAACLDVIIEPFLYVSDESLFIGFSKEDLFIFLQIIFQDFKFFLLLLFYRVTLS